MLPMKGNMDDKWLDEPEESELGGEERSNLELLLKLLMRPQYVYKMAKPMCDAPKEWQRVAARKRRDKALMEIAELIDAYNKRSLWFYEEQEKMRLYAKLEAKRARP